MIRALSFRERSWRIVDENEHTTWVSGQLAEGWEADTFDAIDKYVTGGVFVDVGAWIGMMTLYAAPLASHVYALEPDPVARDMLVRNLDLNGITNVTVLDKALWHSEGVIKLAEHGELGSSMTGPTRDGPSFEVRSITPNMLWNLVQPGPVDLVKVDVEGSEKHILPTLLNWPAPIHLSVHEPECAGWRPEFGGRPIERYSEGSYWSCLVGL